MRHKRQDGILIKDKQIAELCGMTQRNLSFTYKRHKDPEKRRMYELLRLGSEVYFKESNKQKNQIMQKIDKLIKEKEMKIVELRLLKDEVSSSI